MSAYGEPDAGAFYSDAKVAQIFAVSKEQVQRRCASGQWPHLRVGRAYRFTTAHIDRVTALLEHDVKASSTEQTWGRAPRRRRSA